MHGRLPSVAPRAGAILPAVLLLGVVLAASCSDQGNPLGPPTTGAITGTITDIETGAPVRDASVVAIEPSTLVAASKPVRTDSLGRYAVELLPPGEYVVIAIHCLHVVYDRTSPRVRVEAGATSTCDVRLLPWVIWDCRGYRIEGSVRDAVTDLPLPGALVGGIFWAAWWGIGDFLAGNGRSGRGVTDAEGRFSIPALDMYWSPDTVHLEPVSITCQGYEPATLVGPGPERFHGFGAPLLLPSPNDSVLTVSVRLRPLPASEAGLGAVRGRVTWCGQPVTGVPVALSLASVIHPDTLRPQSVPMVPVPDATAVTDAGGEFLIAGVTPGHYFIAPAYRDDDGWSYLGIQPTAGGSPVAPTSRDDARPVRIATAGPSGGFDVSPADTVDLGVLSVAVAVVPLAPAGGATDQPAAPELIWQPVTPPTGYRVLGYSLSYGTGFGAYPRLWSWGSGLLQEPRWTMPDSPGLSPGTHVCWLVTAHGLRESAPPESAVVIGRMETAAIFTVAAR